MGIGGVAVWQRFN